MSNKTRNPLLIDVLAALGDVTISQKYVIDPVRTKSYFVHGMQRGSEIIINEAPSLVSTLLHELIHFVRPSWSERTVRRYTTILLRQLSHQEIQAIYQQYQERKRARTQSIS
jgi:hypothetical protein